MAIDFPSSPTSGQQYQGYTYNSTIGAWQANSAAVAPSTVSANPPANPTVGDMWFNTNDGSQYFYYNDGNTSQWVESRAPITANGYYSPNYVINGGFDIWQRATSTTTTTAGYRTADRWATWIDSGAGTIQADTTNVPAFLQYGIRYTSSGASGSCVFYHTIETLNAELLAGKTVNLSAYLSGTAGKSIQVSLWSSTTTDNAFSGSWTLIGATAYTNTTAVNRVSATYTVPSNVKTIQVRVYNLDKLANTEFVSFTGVQLEEGSSATTFRRNANSLQGELAACQRYYQRIYSEGNYGKLALGWAFTTTQVIAWQDFKVTMRVRPTSIEHASLAIHDNITSVPAISSITLNSALSSSNSANLEIISSSLTAGRNYWLGGNNTGNAYLAFNAEL